MRKIVGLLDVGDLLEFLEEQQIEVPWTKRTSPARALIGNAGANINGTGELEFGPSHQTEPSSAEYMEETDNLFNAFTDAKLPLDDKALTIIEVSAFGWCVFKL
jgi:hypothetical protein